MFGIIQRSKYYIFTAIFFSSLILLFLMLGCGNGQDNRSPSASSQTGSVSLSIRWPPNAIEQRNAELYTAAAFDCQSFGVESVVCEVYDENSEFLVGAGPWPCMDGAGRVDGIAVGSNRTFVIMAEDGDNNILYQGTTTGITIEPNKTTENVVVNISAFKPVLTAPPDGDSVDPNAFSLQWQALENVSQYRVQVSEGPAFETPTINETVSETSYVPTTLAADRDYYWRISAVDDLVNIGVPSDPRSFTTTNCDYTIAPDRLDPFPIEGSPGTFTINPSEEICTYLAVVSDEWITLAEGTDTGSGIGQINYTVAINEDPAGRIGTILVGGQRHIVTQAGTEGLCGFMLEPEEVTVEATEYNGEIEVIAVADDCPWTPVVDVDWVTIADGVDGVDGSGNGIIRYTVAANTGIDSREATITVGGQQIHTISQAGGSPDDNCIDNIFLSPQEFNELGSDGTIDISALTEDCPWEANSNVDWVTFENGMNTISGTGSSNVPFNVMTNNETGERSGTISVNGIEYTISQTGSQPVGCIYQIDPGSGQIGPDGDTGQFNVISSAATCSWSAVSSRQDWVFITSGDTGTGSGIVSYQVTPNDGIERDAAITIQPDGPSYDITQAGNPPPPPPPPPPPE